MRHSKRARGPAGLGTIGVAALVVSASLLFGAQSGISKQGAAAGGSYIRAVVDGLEFTHYLTNGELAQNARDALVQLIDDHPSYSATAIGPPSGPFDADDVFFEVLTEASGEVVNLTVCENDATYANSGVRFASGRSYVTLLAPSMLAGGSFNIRFDMAIAPDVDETIGTTAGNVSGFITDLTSALGGLGFTVTVNGSQIVIAKAGDAILATRIETTDSLFKYTCLGLTNAAPQPPIAMPTLQTAGVVLMVTGLLLAGILILRRRVRV